MGGGNSAGASQSQGSRIRFGLIAVIVIVVVAVIFISASESVDYIHGFGKACLVVHDGWHFHVNCSAVSPPTL